MAHSNIFRRYACGFISLAALALCVCDKVPEYCGDGGRFDFKNQFCFAGAAVDKCGGSAYDPVNYRCEDGRVVSKTTDTTPTVTPPVTPPDTVPTVTPPKTYAAIVSSPGKGATGSGDYLPGATVNISAGAAPDSMQFKNWTSTAGDGVIFANADSPTTSFVMPAKAVTVTAVFEWKSVTPPTTYAVTVTSAGTNHSGTGSYEAGETVTISAGTPPSGQQFKNWTSASSGVGFVNANSATTTFTMPKNAVTVTAVFEAASGIDGQYEYVTLGGKKWMKKNLNEATENSWCYENSSDNCNKYGRLYTWSAAKTACQLVGWQLPTREDWDALAAAVGGTRAYYTSESDLHHWYDAGKALKSTSGWNNNGNGTDSYGFSALPAGVRWVDGSFHYAGDAGFWWTATEDGSGYAYNRYMDYNYDVVNEYDDDVGGTFSARCVKDD